MFVENKATLNEGGYMDDKPAGYLDLSLSENRLMVRKSIGYYEEEHNCYTTLPLPKK